MGSPRGLTDEQIIELRKMRFIWNIPIRRICRELNLPYNTVWKVLTEKTYKDVEGYKRGDIEHTVVRRGRPRGSSKRKREMGVPIGAENSEQSN